jgi:hypothetical protein
MVVPVAVVHVAVALTEKVVEWLVRHLPDVVNYIQEHHLLSKEKIKEIMHSVKPTKEKAKNLILWHHLIEFISKQRHHIWKIVKLFFHFGKKDLAGRLIPKYLTQLEEEHVLSGEGQKELEHLIEIYTENNQNDINWVTNHKGEAKLAVDITNAKSTDEILKLITTYLVGVEKSDSSTETARVPLTVLTPSKNASGPNRKPLTPLTIPQPRWHCPLLIACLVISVVVVLVIGYYMVDSRGKSEKGKDPFQSKG